MAQRNRHHGNRQKPRVNAPQTTTSRTPPATIEKKPPVEYGKPFILLEDRDKVTFIYKGGQWTRHTVSIAECRTDCRVKELPQKINGMTRYEICSPVSISA